MLIIMLNGLHIILAGSVFRYAQAIESLPGVLLAIIAAHISLTFMISMLTIGNSMTQGIYTFTLNDPKIHRSASGFKDGGKTQDLYLHVLFPSSNEQDKTRFNGNPNKTYQEAAQQWSGPQTQQDLKQFHDQVCTWESTTFDSNMRSRIFGRNGDYHNGGLYQLFKQRNDLLNQYDGAKVPDGVQTQLDNILTQIDSDVQKLSSGSDRLAWYNDAFVKQGSWDQQMDDAWTKYGQDIPEAKKNNLSNDGQGGEAMLRANIHKLLAGTPPNEGDLIRYSCQHDATGEDFQLVPDDLDFTNLFKNIQDLTDGLPMVVKVLSLMLLAQMIVRLFFINLYIVTAPIGIACWALPGRVGQPVTRLWLQGFLSTVLVQFIMVVALIVIQVLLGNVLAFVGGNPNNPIGGLDDGTLKDIMRVACLWFIIRIPSLFGSAPMSTMAAAGEMMGQAVGTTVASQAARAQMIAQAVTSFIGLAIAR
ncbi:hypothetical protein KSX_85830 [Ktedonospora formicarum]|uniref:Uncharacterized protein n=1 Tax=Ktedonospora formicarum TaxID=2778364 RepID=A0A8J3MZ51_9CHLR|nr:hypothetical protein KSX_85830 [Ktedonospora formicarum]